MPGSSRPRSARSRPASVRSLTGRALAEPDLDAKAALVEEALALWEAGRLASGSGDDVEPVDVRTPGRPDRPTLVEPRALRSRRLTTPAGRVAAIHAVAHIEANAVNLALDAAHRFGGMPDAYYRDWLGVAAEEATHFRLLRGRLRDHGAEYGDLPAHDGLWTAAVRTADDVLRRMALVPRVLEARGLDVSPAMIERFAAAGDPATAEVLRVVLRDEVGHVAVGDRWFRHCCAERGLEPEGEFATLLDREGVTVAPPFNRADRLRAGFAPGELDRLEALSGSRSRPGPRAAPG
ncbi:MAG: ferritin-like domain-containing protein [Acidimicrobiia bacterium]